MSNHRKKRFVGLLSLLMISLPLFGQPHYTLHKRVITQTDGLPDRNVYCGIQDKNSYLWFGTQSGLCLYDGIQFTYLQKRSHGLRGSAILSLSADDSVGIIIQYIEPGTSRNPDKFLDVVNITTKQVLPFSEYYPTAPFKEHEVDLILHAKGKPIQFLLKGNLQYTWMYTHASGFVKKQLVGKPISAKLPDLNSLTKSQRTKLNQSLQEKFILNSDSSLISLTTTNNKILYIPNQGYIIPFVEPLVNADKLCFLNFNGELLPLDSLNSVAFEPLKQRRSYVWSENYSVNNTYVSPLSDVHNAVMEMVNRDIIFYTPELGFLKIFEQDENIKVRSFFKDHLDAWWLCTNVGIYKLTTTKNVFKNHFSRKNSRFSFNNSARGIYTDDDVSCFNLYDAPVIILENDTILLNTEQNFAAIRVDDALWIGEYYLNKFDLKSRRVTKRIPSKLDEIWSIYPIHHDLFLLGCTGGLALADVNLNRVEKISSGHYPPIKLVYKIFRNNAYKIMAVAENGIYILDDHGQVIDYYGQTSSDKTKHLPSNGIQDVYQDDEGFYWIATSQEGLFRWNKKKHEFLQYGIEHGFLSNIMYGILEDNHQNLWISTNYGLTRFNKKTTHAITYTDAHGIQENEFNRSSSFKDHHGRLYFGGMNGVVSFHPDELQSEQAEKKYNFIITKIITINSSEGILEENPHSNQSHQCIVFSEDTKLSTIHFSLLDYENRQHRYAYMVEGFDKDWNYTNNDHIQISKLPYGNYTLFIKAQLLSGDWYSEQIQIAISVPKPFYKKWWFITLVTMSIITLVTLIIIFRIRVLKNKNIKLEHIVTERTKELQLSLNEQKAMLQEIHHRVKNNLQFIEAIINMQINISKEEKNQHILQDINLRINAMTLVHEMLYVKESVETISVNDYLTELTKKQISIMTDDAAYTPECYSTIENINLNINHCLALGMITTELISNAVKHRTSATSHPIISISLKKDQESQHYVYILRDNGPGIPVKKHSSNGLGMRLIDIFVRQIKGNYSFRNDNGAIFTMEFTVVQ